MAVRKDGKKFAADMAASRSNDEEYGDKNIICFIRDVSKEKEIDRMKTEFIAVASHEMRTPLTSIKNAVDLMIKRKAGEITAGQEKFLSMAKRNIDRLAGLIDSILDISRIESGRMELNYTEMGIGDCIERALGLFKALADQKSISLKMNIDPTLPATYADFSRIEEVMINLIGNAIKFTPNNGVVTVTVHETSEVSDIPGSAKGFLNISVTDNGDGIPEEMIDHVFEKFYQVESSLSIHKKSGSGLGLAISKYIVEAHGGKIQCKSKEGHGITFSFTIPVIDREMLFFNSIKGTISKAIQKYSPLSILVLTIKIADFEHFMEVYGEKECEKILNVAKEKIIEGRIKKTDLINIAPWNGEIIVVMPDTDSTGSRIVQQRVDKDISGSEIVVGNTSYGHLISAGIATFPEDGKSPEELLYVARKLLKIDD